MSISLICLCNYIYSTGFVYLRLMVLFSRKGGWKGILLVMEFLNTSIFSERSRGSLTCLGFIVLSHIRSLFSLQSFSDVYWGA